MNELQVRVKQTVGEITWNFEDLKASLAEQIDVYKNIAYTDSTIGEAKKDVAALRKLSKAVNDRKVEIKKKCLEPYGIIEKQAAELMDMIAEPIGIIDKKVKQYEADRRASVKAKRTGEMKEMFSDLPEDIVGTLIRLTYNPKLENATATEKEFRDAVKAAHDKTVEELKVLAGLDEDFRDEAMKVYMADLSLSAAMAKAMEMQKQKERIAERMRQEAERKRLEAERIRREAEQKDLEADSIASWNEESAQAKEEEDAPQTETSPAAAAVPPVNPETNGRKEHVISIFATDEEFTRIAGYIKYVGASYAER